jgi:hypothetical protein
MALNGGVSFYLKNSPNSIIENLELELPFQIPSEN